MSCWRAPGPDSLHCLNMKAAFRATATRMGARPQVPDGAHSSTGRGPEPVGALSPPPCLDSPHPGPAMCLNVGAHRPIQGAEMHRAVSRLRVAGPSSPKSVPQELSAVQSS